MKIENILYSVINWNKLDKESHKGEKGEAFWQVFEKGNIRARVVEYSPGYIADHWCSRGHVIYVIEGEMINELKDGTKTKLTAGMGYIVQDDESNPHKTYTDNGVKLFIVD